MFRFRWLNLSARTQKLQLAFVSQQSGYFSSSAIKLMAWTVTAVWFGCSHCWCPLETPLKFICALSLLLVFWVSHRNTEGTCHRSFGHPAEFVGPVFDFEKRSVWCRIDCNLSLGWFITCTSSWLCCRLALWAEGAWLHYSTKQPTVVLQLELLFIFS